MLGIHDALRGAGIRLVRDGECPGLSAECAALARRLRELRVRTVALVPAMEDVAVPGVALHLGRALAGTSVRPVAVVDAMGSWIGPRPARVGEARGLLVTSWLEESLALLSPSGVAPMAALRQLEGLLASEGATFEHLVLDLTGFRDLGQQLGACELVEAVLLVARCGATRTRGVMRRLRELSGTRCLGVLLTGT